MYPAFAPKTAAFAAKIASVGFFSTNSTLLPGKVKVPIVVDPPTSSITVTSLAVVLLLTRRTTVALPKVDAPAASVPQDPDVEAEAQITDAEYQKDTKSAEI